MPELFEDLTYMLISFFFFFASNKNFNFPFHKLLKVPFELCAFVFISLLEWILSTLFNL